MVLKQSVASEAKKKSAVPPAPEEEQDTKTQDPIHQLRLLENDNGFLTYVDPLSGAHYAFIKEELSHPVFLPGLSAILYGAPNSITKLPVDSYFL